MCQLACHCEMSANDMADLYLRVSIDREEREGIDRQEVDCRSWAERSGLSVRRVHVDRGKSGYKDVSRVGFDDAITAVTSGIVGTLVVWKLDRLSRRGVGEVADVLQAFDEVGGRLVSVMDRLDTSTDFGREAVGLLAEFARAESRSTGLRVGNAKQHLRKTGRWIGGRPPYGLKLDPTSRRLIRDPETAGHARLIAEMAISGSTLLEIARRLNRSGIPSARGGEWNSSSVLQLLRSPSFAGLMPQTEYSENPDGTRKYGSRVAPYRDPETLTPVEIGEGAITVDERELILRHIQERASESAGRRYGRKQATALLTGFTRCGRCGSRMSKAGTSYQCSRRRMGRDCRGVSVLVKSIDNYVVEAARARMVALEPGDRLLAVMVARRARSEHPEMFGKRDAIEAEMASVRERRADLEAARYLRGEFEGPGAADRYTALVGRLEMRLEELHETIEAFPTPDTGHSQFLDREWVRRAWETSGDPERRDLLALMIDQIEVRPGAVGVRFDGASRVGIRWADTAVSGEPAR